MSPFLFPIDFFATRRDLEALCAAVEVGCPLRYFRAGMFATLDKECWDSGLNLPSLGTASFGDQSKEPIYLVLKASSVVQVRQVAQRGGGVMYAIDQLRNPASVAFRPGGVLGDAVVAGQVGTASACAESIELMRKFEIEIRRQFNRIKSYYVGKEAELMLDGGKRLTGSLASPSDFDLSRT